MAKSHADLPSSQQAANVIVRFGGAYALSRALAGLQDPRALRHPSVIFRWTYPRTRGGTDGMIPNAAWPYVKRAARFVGIFLTSDEVQP